MQMDEILSQVSLSEMASHVQPESYRLYSEYKHSMAESHCTLASA